MKTDVIIPVYKPDEKLNKLVSMLFKGTLAPDKIILMWTYDESEAEINENQIFDAAGDDKCKIKIYPVKKSEFDHGATRNLGASYSDADRILFMTEDAVPNDKYLIEKLSEKIDNGASAVFARQIAETYAPVIEKMTREFNYPGESYVMTFDDIKKYGIKAVFCSNSCMMYDKKVFSALGGFDENVVFAEDMLFSYKLLMNKYKLFYAADIKVIHSHDYTLKQQYKRSFDTGRNQKMHPEVFKSLSSENEGMKYFKYVSKNLFKMKKLYLIPYFVISCFVRFAGFKAGKRKK